MGFGGSESLSSSDDGGGRFAFFLGLGSSLSDSTTFFAFFFGLGSSLSDSTTRLDFFLGFGSASLASLSDESAGFLTAFGAYLISVADHDLGVLSLGRPYLSSSPLAIISFFYVARGPKPHLRG